jgi:hypothetical protein
MAGSHQGFDTAQEMIEMIAGHRNSCARQQEALQAPRQSKAEVAGNQYWGAVAVRQDYQSPRHLTYRQELHLVEMGGIQLLTFVPQI